MRLARFAPESDSVVNAPLPNALGKIGRVGVAEK